MNTLRSRLAGAARRRPGPGPVLVALLLLAGARPAAAQLVLPDSFTNLKVLPKNISKEQLLGTMRSFTEALGVRCDYCHVRQEGTAAPAAGAPGGAPPRFDFARDDKVTKRRARVMLEMVRAIDTEYLPKLPDRATPGLEVHCITCHRGVARPQQLSDLLADTAAARGVTAAMDTYRRLKSEYDGSGAYDFREGSLEELALRESTGGHADDALAVLDFVTQEFPDSRRVPFLQGEVLLKKGDRAGAIERYRRALQLDPRNEAARRRLAELGAAK